MLSGHFTHMVWFLAIGLRQLKIDLFIIVWQLFVEEKLGWSSYYTGASRQQMFRIKLTHSDLCYYVFSWQCTRKFTARPAQTVNPISVRMWPCIH